MPNPTLPVPAADAQTGWFDAMAAWLDRPEHFDGLGWRRVFAYVVDLVVLSFLLSAAWMILWAATFVTFGLLAPLLGVAYVATPLVPMAYHTLTIGGPRSATWGMRLFDVELRSWSGERPDLGRAFLGTLLFYATVTLTGGLILLLGLFNRRRRLAHDLLCGLVAVRASAMTERQMLPPGRHDA